MKRVRVLNHPTPGLADYSSSRGNNANWEEFRSHNAGSSYHELREALAHHQHGLCAYCEIDLIGLDCQIEHVVPQSDAKHGQSRSLEVTNLIACCKGGTERMFASDGRDEEARYLKPVKHNQSCGQAKGNRVNGDLVDPRTLTALPSLTRVAGNGLIEADEHACRTVGLVPDRVTRTIKMLYLNAKRLQVARDKLWNDLVEVSGQIDDMERMDAWIRSLLTPDPDDRLPRFFTTSRCYFAPLSERILEEHPQTWI